jgi:hypothetical protein
MYNRLPYVSRGIFSRLDIMYQRLSYVSGCALLFKTLVLYIYQSRGTMTINQPFHQFYSPTIFSIQISFTVENEELIMN